MVAVAVAVEVMRRDTAGSVSSTVIVASKRQQVEIGGGSDVGVPTANDRIDEGDRLVVAGSKKAVEAMDAI